MVRTRLKLAATLTVVVLALTGFQTSSGGGTSTGKPGKVKSTSKSKSGSSGGGCSSSKKKNDDYDDDDEGSTYTPSPSSSSPASDLVIEVFDCVEPGQKKSGSEPDREADTTASIRVTPRDGVSGTYRVALEFERSDGSPVDLGEIVIDVKTPDAKIYDVAMKHPGTVAEVKRCTLGDVIRQPESTPTPTATAS
ncbi:hypothetical protein [Streptomyces sp. NPDC048623]|uniref:hypothetical protein n=1 Tax=Streptomyces sp. NPDC048623 TaxID=3155761 RepID=UPI003437C400